MGNMADSLNSVWHFGAGKWGRQRRYNPFKLYKCVILVIRAQRSIIAIRAWTHGSYHPRSRRPDDPAWMWAVRRGCVESRDATKKARQLFYLIMRFFYTENDMMTATAPLSMLQYCSSETRRVSLFLGFVFDFCSAVKNVNVLNVQVTWAGNGDLHRGQGKSCAVVS
jgi:hypothetical protein